MQVGIRSHYQNIFPKVPVHAIYYIKSEYDHLPVVVLFVGQSTILKYYHY